MKISLTRNQQVVPFYFAAPISKLVAENKFLFQETNKYLIITNQTSYDRYYEKLRLAIGNEFNQFWYVCPNGQQSANLAEFSSVLAYCEEMELRSSISVIAFGDEGVSRLAGFFASLYLGGVSLIDIPTTLMGLEISLLHQVALNHQRNLDILATQQTVSAIFFEARFLQDNQLSELQEGFSCWLQLAVTLDSVFYDLLKEQFPTRKELEIKSVVPYVTSYLNLIETSNKVKSDGLARYFGSEFHLAITLNSTEESMSSNSLAIGLSFSLLISAKYMGASLDLDGWFKWLADLNYDLNLPKSWFITDLLAKLTQNDLGKKTILMVLLDSFGKLKQVAVPVLTVAEAIEEYQLIKK